VWRLGAQRGVGGGDIGGMPYFRCMDQYGKMQGKKGYYRYRQLRIHH
jgi:hypothetical protein